VRRLNWHGTRRPPNQGGGRKAFRFWRGEAWRGRGGTAADTGLPREPLVGPTPGRRSTSAEHVRGCEEANSCRSWRFSTPVIPNGAGESSTTPVKSSRSRQDVPHDRRSGRRGDGAARATERCRSLRSAPRISLNLASPRRIIWPRRPRSSELRRLLQPSVCTSPLTRRGTRRAFSLNPRGRPVLGRPRRMLTGVRRHGVERYG